MYFSNRTSADKLGLCFSSLLILYFGPVAPPMLLSEIIRDSIYVRCLSVLFNVLLCLNVLLFLYVSSARGYLKEEEYTRGGKFCYECKHAKAERAHHCSRCKKCITRMDHHCPWIGACVNGENTGNFIKLLFLSLICASISIFLHGCAIQKKIRVKMGNQWYEPSFFVLIVNVLVLLCLLFALNVLFIRQIRMALKNTTYLESLQLEKLDDLGIAYPKNPYDRGKLENIKEVFGTAADFLLCRTPERMRYTRYSNYWPPLRITKSGSIQSSISNANTSMSSSWNR